MRRLVHVVIVLGILLGSASFAPTAAQSMVPIDLASIPLPVQDLPENGYQVFAGDYLPQENVAWFIGSSRNFDEADIDDRIGSIGTPRVYVLDLALAEDRAWVDSGVLALVQTSVYEVESDESANALFDILTDFSRTDYVEEHSPAVEGGVTVGFVGPMGDQIRTVFVQDNIVVEILSLDATGTPNEAEHQLIVEATQARIEPAQNADSIGLSTMAMKVDANQSAADFFNAPQTGVHGLYRLRDGQIQPAYGELNPDVSTMPQGQIGAFYSHGVVAVGSGEAMISVKLYEVDSEDAAAAWTTSLQDAPSNDLLVDPYLGSQADETTSTSDTPGEVKVSGSFGDQRYSGLVRFEQQGRVVVIIGYRVVGSSLPDAAVSTAMMDHQLQCLKAQSLCETLDISALVSSPSATPVASPVGLGSSEFGWSLPDLGPEWQVTERFAEPGYDRISLQNGVSLFEVESVIDHHGNPVECVLDEQHMLQEFEEHAAITIWKDAAGNSDGGHTTTTAWVTYRVEPLADERADQEYVIRIDCSVLIPGSANLVIKQIAPVDAWETERSKGESLRNGIVMPELLAPRGTIYATTHDRRTAVIHFPWIDRAA